MVTTRATSTLPTLGRRSLPVLGAAVLVALALLTQGGDLTQPPTQLPTSWVDVALILAGGVAVAGLVILPRDSGAGTLTLGLFAGLAALTALSIAWSVVPDQSWEESGRTVAYLAVFAVGLVVARLGSGSSRGAVVTIALSATALCVWALGVKVFDLNLYGQRDYGRLLAPFTYWNATGLTGALALPGLIWLAARRDHPLAAGLAVAGITLAATVVALSYSRSASAAALFGTVLPLFFIRSRRRAVVMLVIGLIGCIPICLFAFTDHAISGDTSNSLYGGGPAQLHRTVAGLVLGVIILVVVLIVACAAALLIRRLDAEAQPTHRLRWFDLGLGGAVLAVPAVIALWLLFNARGPSGEISHLWHSLTGNNPGLSDQPGRFASLDNSRSAYWRQALSIGRHHPLAGAGAGTFYPALQRYGDAILTPPGNTAHDAHSYVLDNFASFGLIGIGLNLAVFCSWWWNAFASVRARAVRFTGAVAAREIDARWALIGVVVAYGASSAIDYTWYFPGVTVPALLAAGWIAGVRAPARATPAQLASAGPTRPAVAPRRSLSARPGAILALTALAAATLIIAWESLAPMRSVQSAAASLNALSDRNGPVALTDARAAVSEDPLSAAAYEQLATVDEAYREPTFARTELIKATQAQPENAQPFATLGGYLLCRGSFAAAAVSLGRAQVLDITDSYKQTEALADARSHHRLCDAIN